MSLSEYRQLQITNHNLDISQGTRGQGGFYLLNPPKPCLIKSEEVKQ